MHATLTDAANSYFIVHLRARAYVPAGIYEWLVSPSGQDNSLQTCQKLSLLSSASWELVCVLYSNGR